MKFSNKNKNLILVILLILSVEAFLFNAGNIKIKKMRSEREMKINNLFSDPNILAKSFSVFDITLNKKIYSKNGNQILPMASLVKTMTVLVSLENHTKDSYINISKEALNVEGNDNLLLNEKWNINDLAKFTLMVSSNDGATALADGDKDFINKMNIKAKNIGLLNTVFYNPTGLDIDITQNKSGAYTTADDANILAINAEREYSEIFSGTTISKANIKSNSGYIHKVENTNTILDTVPNVLFSKTGLTDLAGGNLTMIFKNKNKKDIAITVLGSTKEGRFSDMEKLINISNNI